MKARRMAAAVVTGYMLANWMALTAAPTVAATASPAISVDAPSIALWPHEDGHIDVARCSMELQERTHVLKEACVKVLIEHATLG